MYPWTFCIYGRFVGWMFCRGGRFASMDVLYRRMFCQEGCYVEGRFVDGRFMEGRFVEGRFLLVSYFQGDTLTVALPIVYTKDVSYLVEPNERQ